LGAVVDKPRVGEIVRAVAARLAAAGVPTPEVDARLLVGHVLAWTPAQVRLGAAEPLPEAAREPLGAAVERRAGREPLQLIVGSVGFRHVDIAVLPGVFIPRPETEVLAGAAIARTPGGGVVVEPCTGTGAVACAIAQEARPSLVVATDSSPAAVELARRNAAALLAVEVLQGHLLDPVPAELAGRVDVLVANPPYVAAGEVAGLEPEVTEHDPLEALVSGPTGHEVTDELIALAGRWLAPAGWLLMEVDPRRAAEVARRCRAAGLEAVGVRRDLTGRSRMISAHRT
jgi:release factor glutamine methyltransferase